MRGRRRREYEEARRSLRAWARASSGPDWTEEQWRGILSRAVRQSPEPWPSRRAPLWRPALAAASMLAALAAGAWYVAVGPGSPAAALPDSRAGEMLPADPADLVAPGRSAAPAGLTSEMPLLPPPPENLPAWLHPGYGPRGPVWLYLPPALNR